MTAESEYIRFDHATDQMFRGILRRGYSEHDVIRKAERRKVRGAKPVEKPET